MSYNPATDTPALKRRRMIIFFASIAIGLTALATLPNLLSPLRLRGEFVDRNRGLSADSSATTASNVVVNLFTHPEYSNGFREIIQVTAADLSEARIERIASWAGDTWYSATLTLPRPDTSKQWHFRMLRGSEAGGTGIRRFDPKWWINDVLIEWDSASQRVSKVEFLGDRSEDRRLELPGAPARQSP